MSWDEIKRNRIDVLLRQGQKTLKAQVSFGKG